MNCSVNTLLSVFMCCDVSGHRKKEYQQRVSVNFSLLSLNLHAFQVSCCIRFSVALIMLSFFLLYVQRISRDVRGHMKMNIEQKVDVHLAYPHMMLPIPQFVFVNSELVFFQMVPDRVRQPSCWHFTALVRQVGQLAVGMMSLHTCFVFFLFSC